MTGGIWTRLSGPFQHARDVSTWGVAEMVNVLNHVERLQRL